MDQERWNYLANKARHGTLHKEEQLEVVRAIAESQEREHQTSLLFAACVICYGQSCPEVPDGSHRELFVTVRAKDQAAKAAGKPEVDFSPQRQGYTIRFVSVEG